MGMNIRSAYVPLLIFLALSIFKASDSCPTDTDSCCECIAYAGCSWYHDPSQGRRPFCAEGPFLPVHGNTTHNEDFVTPSEAVRSQIPASKNRPINLNRGRIIRPQGAQISLPVGLEYELPIEILSRSRKLEIMLIGPNQAPEFRLETDDSTSCMDGFRKSPVVGNAGGRRGGQGGNAARRRPGGSRRHRMTRRAAAAGRRGNRGGAGRNGRGNRRNVRRERFECLSSAPGLVNKFRLVIYMPSCMASKKVIKVIVKEQGVKKRVKVSVNSLCECPCEVSTGSTGDNDGQCESGKMTCPDQAGSAYYGDECAGSNLRCVSPDGGRACSGQGTCLCGSCICDAIQGLSSSLRYSGQYCECNNHNCPRQEGLICGGPTRGICACGRCVCQAGFQGDACQYDLSMSALCQEPDSPDGIVCNGHGNCVNGFCVCEPPYVGAVCQDCPTCIRPSQCIVMKVCVECVLFDNPETARLCSMRCGIMTLESFRPVEHLNGTEGNMCMYQHTDGCWFKFAYTSALEVFYQTTMHCPTESDEDV